MMVGEHAIQTFEVVVVVLLLLLLSFDVIVPISAHPFSFLDRLFVKIYLNLAYKSIPYYTLLCLIITYFILLLHLTCFIMNLLQFVKALF